MDRFDRQRRLFGDEGQRRLQAASVGIVGGGGIGSFVLLELAYLGIGKIVLVDGDHLEASNRNRLVGAWESHPHGVCKVQILSELAKSIDSSIEVRGIPNSVEDDNAKRALAEVDVVMGCVDDDGPRILLNGFCCEQGIPYIDASSGTFVEEDRVLFGGRVCVATQDTGCLMCFDVLDQNEIRAYTESPEKRADRAATYGVPNTALDRAGPSVVTVNGVVASFAATELMVLVTGIRAPRAHTEWRGHSQQLLQHTDREKGCFYCGLRPCGRSPESG